MKCKEKNLDCKQHQLSSNICSWYLATMYIFCRKEYLNLQKMHVSFKCNFKGMCQVTINVLYIIVRC